MGQNNQKDQKGPKMRAAVMLVQNKQNNQKIWSPHISLKILKVLFFLDTLYNDTITIAQQYHVYISTYCLLHWGQKWSDEPVPACAGTCGLQTCTTDLLCSAGTRLRPPVVQRENQRTEIKKNWDFVRSALQTLREASIESAMFSMMDFPTF